MSLCASIDDLARALRAHSRELELLRSPHQLATKQDLIEMENRIMKTLTELLADVADETTVVDSVVSLLTSLHDQLNAAIAANDPAQIQAVADAIAANKSKMAAAVAANTPGVSPA